MIAIATTVRAGRSGHLVLVRETVSFHLQNINAAFMAHGTPLTMGVGVSSWGKVSGGLNLTSHFHFVGW